MFYNNLYDKVKKPTDLIIIASNKIIKWSKNEHLMWACHSLIINKNTEGFLIDNQQVKQIAAENNGLDPRRNNSKYLGSYKINLKALLLFYYSSSLQIDYR